jgi:hypothetical protein
VDSPERRHVFTCAADRVSEYDDLVTITPILLAATMALTPLASGQQARLTAWLDWATAYRDCYVPAPFSLNIDEDFTARCIERTLRRQPSGPPEERAATQALIAATPQLIMMLNTPTDPLLGNDKSARLDPPGPQARRLDR